MSRVDVEVTETPPSFAERHEHHVRVSQRDELVAAVRLWTDLATRRDDAVAAETNGAIEQQETGEGEGGEQQDEKEEVSSPKQRSERRKAN